MTRRFVPLHARRAMTLLELVFALGLVAVLATVAAVSYATVQSNAKDRAAVEVVRAVGLDAQQVVAGDSRQGFTSQDVAAAVSALPNTSGSAGVVAAGVHAAVEFRTVTTPSTTYGEVSATISADSQSIGVAMVSETGNCVWSNTPVRGEVKTGVWGRLGDACRGESALTPGTEPQYEPPGPPSAPVLSGVCHDLSATLTWTAPPQSDVAGYRVFQSGSQVASVGASVLSTDVTGLVNGRAYSFTTTAYDRAGYESSASNTVQVTPCDDVAPTIPANLSATAGDRSASLSWTASSDNTPVSYRVFRDGTQLATTSSTTYLDAGTAPNGLTPGRQYSYYIVAYDTSQNASSPSSTATATPFDATAPPTPTGLAATNGEVRQSTVSWSQVTSPTGDLAGYRLYKVVSGASQLIYQGTNLQFVATGLSDGVATSFRVSSYDTYGNESAQSNAVAGTPLALPGTPAPTATGGTRQVTVSWAQMTDAATYDVQTSAGSSLSTGQSTTSYTQTGLADGTSYSYRVRACNAAGCSGWGASNTATTAPAAPTVSSSVSQTTVTVSWSAPTAASTYNLQRQTAGGAFGSIGSSLTVTSYTDSGLNTATTYGYRVQACNSGGCSDWSQTTSQTTVPGSVAVSATATNTQVALSWPAATAATSYDIRRQANGGSWSIIVTDRTSRAYTDSGLSASTRYGYQVRSCNTAGCSGWGATDSTTTVPNAPSINTSQSMCDPYGGAYNNTGTGQCALVWSESNATSFDAYFYNASCNDVATCAAVASLTNTTSTSAGPWQGQLGDNRGRVRACNGAGCSAYSVQTLAAAPKPPRPTVSALGCIFSYCGWTFQAQWATSYEVAFSQGVDGNVRCDNGCWGGQAPGIWTSWFYPMGNQTMHVNGLQGAVGGGAATVYPTQIIPAYLGVVNSRVLVQSTNYYYCTPTTPGIPPTVRCDTQVEGIQ